MADHAITEQNFGAWVLKCNPQKVWDIDAFREEGNHVIDDWSVVENYRSNMMVHGQPVLLWVTHNPGGATFRGFWGAGIVTGSPQYMVLDEENGEDYETGAAEEDGKEGPGFWVDDELRVRMRYYVPVHIPLWDEGISAEDVKAIPGLSDIEVFVSPQMANPSWLTAEQYAALKPHLPEAPGWTRAQTELAQAQNEGTTETVEEETVGQGFGANETNQLVELLAVAEVREHYEGNGWTVFSVEDLNLGWDLTCTPTSGLEHRVEVKGTSGKKRSVLITANELRAAEHVDGWRLAVVTSALTDPDVSFVDPTEVLKAAVPYAFRVSLDS